MGRSGAKVTTMWHRLQSTADSIVQRVKRTGPRHAWACTKWSIPEFIVSGQSVETGGSLCSRVAFGFGRVLSRKPNLQRSKRSTNTDWKLYPPESPREPNGNFANEFPGWDFPRTED